MQGKLKVSIGIPAYNESNNIKNVIKDILCQKRDGWELEELIVICDGCTDNTAQKARELKNSCVIVLEDGKRLGKTRRLKELFEIFKGGVLIMFDGDIRLSGRDVISRLIEPLVTQREVMLVGGNSMPFTPKTFIEKAVYSTFLVFYESRKKIGNGNNIFGATGSILAIRRGLAKGMNLPQIVCEDAFIYLDCIRKGFSFRYVDSAIVYYKLPTTFGDYVKQVFRSNPESVQVELEQYFGPLVYKEFERPVGFYLRNVIAAFVGNPIGVTSIIIVNLFCRPFHNIIMKRYKLEWFTAISTH